MADYRQFCGTCGAETTFGGHKADCESARRVREAEKARREWEAAMRAELQRLDDHEARAALVELYRRSFALSQELAAVDKHILAVKDEVKWRGNGFEMIRDAEREARGDA